MCKPRWLITPLLIQLPSILVRVPLFFPLFFLTRMHSWIHFGFVTFISFDNQLFIFLWVFASKIYINWYHSLGYSPWPSFPSHPKQKKLTKRASKNLNRAKPEKWHGHTVPPSGTPHRPFLIHNSHYVSSLSPKTSLASDTPSTREPSSIHPSWALLKTWGKRLLCLQ